MVTTRRSSEIVNNAYDNGASKGGVGLLERPMTYSAPVESAPAVERESQSQAKERMQKNLDKLLNYARYSAQQMEEVQETVAVAPAPVNVADEDIRPTSTTMQFGEDIDTIREEMNHVAVNEENSYQLNGKGKFAVILYSIAVTVILALIVLNTGVLASLSNANQAQAKELETVMQRYDQIMTEIDNISSSDYIINVAENEYGMVRK